jgi:hypothetical protein
MERGLAVVTRLVEQRQGLEFGRSGEGEIAQVRLPRSFRHLTQQILTRFGSEIAIVLLV